MKLNGKIKELIAAQKGHGSRRGLFMPAPAAFAVTAVYGNDKKSVCCA